MPGDEKILSDADRAKLDGIVNKMIENNEKDEDVQFVVNDFKDKYGSLKKKEFTTSPSALPSTQETGVVPSVLEGGTSGLASTPSVSAEPTLTTKDGKPFLNMPSITGEKAQVPPPVKAVTTQADITTQDQVFKDPNIAKLGLKHPEKLEALEKGIAGLASSVTKVPAFMYDVSVAMATHGDPVLQKALDKLSLGSSGQLADKTGIHNVIAEEIDAAKQRSEQELSKKYDQTITDYFFGEKPDYGKGFDLLSTRVIESLPTTIALAVANAGGATALETIMGGGAAFGAEKRSQLEGEDNGMSEGSKTINAIVSGLAEGLTEQLPISQIANLSKRVFLKEGAEAAKKIAAEGYRKVFGKAVKEYGGIFASDAIGEVANQFSENVNDILTGADPNRKLTDGLTDALFISLGSSAAMTGPVAAIDVAKTATGYKRATEIEKHRNDLAADLQDENVSPEVKPIIAEKIKQLNKEDANIADSEKRLYEALPEDKKKEVDNLIQEKDKIINAMSDETVSDQTKEVFQRDLDANDAKIEAIYEEHELAIDEESLARGFDEEVISKRKVEEGERKKPEMEVAADQSIKTGVKEVTLPGIDDGGVKGLPRKMVFDEADQKWKQKVGDVTTVVSDQAQVEAQDLYESELNNKREELQGSDIVSSSINVAPLFSQKIKNMDEANQLHATRFYKKYKQDVRDVSSMFGVEITEEQDGIGGFDNLSEATTVFKVKGNFDDIVKLAAVLGSLTPEVQESTIASMYVPKGDKNHNADQFELGIDNKEAAIKAARDAGFESTGYTIVGDKISFLDLFDFPDLDFEKKLTNFDKKYKEYGGRIESENRKPVRSEYIDSKRRKNIISEVEGTTLRREYDGSGIRDIIGKAKQRTDNYRKWKAIDSTHSAKRYKELRKKQIDLSAEGKKLSKEEKAEISKLEKYLAEPLASIIANDKNLYEEAKKDIDAITNEVSGIVDGGFSLKPSIKRPSRAAEKVIRWYDVQPNLLNDGARATIIVNNESDADFVFNHVKQMYSVPGMRKPVNEKTFLGFQKRLIEIRAENGKIVEVQVTTPAVYLAKEGIDHFLPDNKKAAEKALEEVREKVGFDIPEGGGHFFYEISRDENVQDDIVKKANDLSKKYYDLFFEENFSMSESDFKKELSDFVEAVDNADKKEWDPSNKGKVPESIREFINKKPKSDATKKGNVTESDKQQHQKRDESGKTTKASDSNRDVESGKKQKEVKPKEDQAKVSETEKKKTDGKETEKTNEADEAKVLVEEEPAPEKKKAPSKELIDEEEEADAEVKEDQDTIDKMDKDIAAAKNIDKNDKEVIKKSEAKFKGAIERAWKAKEEGKIKKTTYTAFRNVMQEVLGPKLNVKKEEAKARVEQLKEEVKKKLLGEGYKKIILAGPGFGPAQVAHLIDVTANLIKKGIDAGYTVSEAIDNALVYIKKQAIYKKLVEKGHLDEEAFDKSVKEILTPKEEKKKEAEQKKEEAKKDVEEKKRKTTERLVDSKFVDSDIRDGLIEQGYNYTPKGINMAQTDARKVVKFFNDGGKLDQLIDKVKNSSEMGRVEKNSMAASIFEFLNKEIGKTTDQDVKNDLRKKAVDIHRFLAQNLTESAQDLRINGTINKSIAEGDPDVAVTLLKEQAQKNIEKNLGTKKQKEAIEKTVNSINDLEAEVEKRVGERVTEEVEKEIDRRILKVVPQATLDKINSFFDKITIKASGKLFADVTGLGGLTMAAWNGSIFVVRNTIKAGLLAYNGIANSKMINKAIQDGIDYIKENHSTETFDEKEYETKVKGELIDGLKEAGIEIKDRTARKKDITDTVKEAISEINESKKDPKKEVKKVTADEKRAEIEKAKALIDTSFRELNMSDYAKGKLAADVLDHLENNDGKITKKKFKELYAEALGYDFVTPEIEADIKSNFQEITKATKIQEQIEQALNEAVSKEKEYTSKGEKMPSSEREAFIKKINKLRSEHVGQTLKAQKANDKISDYFREGKNFYRMLSATIQGNLLTPMSQIFNITSYLYTIPIRLVGGIAGTSLDIIESGLARTKLFGNSLDKNLKTNTFASTYYGLKYGIVPGLREAAFKLKTGQLSEDTALRDVAQKYNAFDSLYALLSGKLKGKDAETKLTTIFEGTFGIPAEIMFRLLGPADIMVRKNVEYGKLAEFAKAEGLEGFELMREILNPSEATREKAQLESLKASYQGENLPTKVIKFIDKGMEDWVNKIAGEKLGYHINGALKIAKTGIIPFTKTPINVVSELFQYAFPPISVAKATVSAIHGDRKGFNDAMGKAFVGAGLSYLAYQLILNGLITGAPDDEDKDKERRAMYENIGYKKLNYSALLRFTSGDKNWNKIKNGDTWVNYEKMGLPGMVISAWAGYYKDRTPEEMRQQNFGGDIFTGVFSTLKASLEQSFLKGTSDALMALMSPGSKKAQYFFVNYAGSLASMVYPNTAAVISKSSDPFVRDKRTDEGIAKMLVNDFKVKMFMGDQLPSRVTLWGEDARKVPQGTNPYYYYLISPLKSNDVNTQTFGYKIFDFWRSVSESTNKELKNKILPSIPQKSIRMDGQEIPLTDQEYNNFQKLVGRNRTEEAKAYVLYGDFDTDNAETRAQTLQKIYASAYSDAKDELIDNTRRLQEISIQ